MSYDMAAKITTIPFITYLPPPISSKPRRPQPLKFINNANTPLHISYKKSLETFASNTNWVENPISNSDIRELCTNGFFERAMQQFESMREQRNIVDEETCIRLLKLCEWKRAVREGSEVYSYIRSSFKRFNKNLGNTLLSMFVRFGNLLDAWYVFGKMEERDVFSWNILVGGYAKSGYFDETLNLYHQMLWVGIKPDLYTFPCVLRTCGGIPNLERGKEIHAHVLRFGFEIETDVINALITMYCKCGDPVSARDMFDKMPNKDRISWNAMISGYVENMQPRIGLELFSMMQLLSIEPDLVTMTCVISACDLIGEERLGKGIHGYVLKTKFESHVAIGNALIQMYSTFGKLEKAEKVFFKMTFKDMVSWTSIISGYEKNGFSQKAIEAYKQMKLDNVKIDEITIATVLSASGSLGRLDVVEEIHEFATQTELVLSPIVGNMLIDVYSKFQCIEKAIEVFRGMPEKNVISWTSLIQGCWINSRSIEALNFFREMLSLIEPNPITLLVTLCACSNVGALMCGKEIHAHAVRRGIMLEEFLPNAILDMYVKCGRTGQAWTFFDMLEEKDVSSWNIMLSSYIKPGYGSLAIDLFDRMNQVGTRPDEITFVALLCACSRSGKVSEGKEYFINMSQQYLIIPNLKHYASMVDLLSRAGQLQEAYNFIKSMPIKPDAAIWGALLNGCRIHHNIELGELAACYIFELDSVSVGYYVLLSNLYAESGKWNEVAKMRKMMRDRGLVVDPGCSWVEVKGKIHAFLSGDESHPQMKEITSLLNGLYARMRSDGLNLPENYLLDANESSKAQIFCGHSERLAVAFGLISTVPGVPIWVTKNLYMCKACHDTVKYISKIVRRDITVRDTEHFHHFKDGACSCGDEGYWVGTTN